MIRGGVTIKGARDELLQVIRKMSEDKKVETDPLAVSSFDKYIENLKKVAGMLLNLMPEDLQPCPRCDGAMCIRRSRANGTQFLGCTKYPQCRGTRPWPPIPAVPPQSAKPKSMRDVYIDQFKMAAELSGMAKVVNLNDAKRREQREREQREEVERTKRQLEELKARQKAVRAAAEAAAEEQRRRRPSNVIREFQKARSEPKPKPKPKKKTSFDRELDIDFDE